VLDEDGDGGDVASVVWLKARWRWWSRERDEIEMLK